ncbi:MAG: hypothetical protein LBT85_00415 [Bifidobacteriaceae bacterium]|jgi:hypothetical protein|nr:hypothetical protein [Bifidobacteriaceae bacterium]
MLLPSIGLLTIISLWLAFGGIIFGIVGKGNIKKRNMHINNNFFKKFTTSIGIFISIISILITTVPIAIFTTVNDYSKLAINNVCTRVEEDGFTCKKEYIDSIQEKDIFLSQYPKTNSTVLKGGEITVNYSNGKKLDLINEIFHKKFPSFIKKCYSAYYKNESVCEDSEKIISSLSLSFAVSKIAYDICKGKETNNAFLLYECGSGDEYNGELYVSNIKSKNILTETGEFYAINIDNFSVSHNCGVKYDESKYFPFGFYQLRYSWKCSTSTISEQYPSKQLIIYIIKNNGDAKLTFVRPTNIII